MIDIRELVVVPSTDQPAADCHVCGSEIEAGEGTTVRYGDRTLRFKCPGCLARFRKDPDRFLSGGGAACCSGEHVAASLASEWSCDRP